MFESRANQFTAAMSPRDAERVVLRALTKAAQQSAPCPTSDELAALIPDGTVTRTVDIVKRLERRGLIRVKRYQRGREVTIVSTGKRTRPVVDGTPHWRERPRSIPAPAPDSIRTRNPDTFSQIMVAATQENRAIADFLADLVWIGFEAYQNEGAKL